MISPELIAPFQMGVLFVLIVAALGVLATEALSIELTALTVISVLIVFFHFFPVIGPNGEDLLDLRHLLSGFANPALIAVLALLVAAGYAMFLAVTLLSAADSALLRLLDLDQLRKSQASLWCLSMLALTGMLAYLAGRFSVRWQRMATAD